MDLVDEKATMLSRCGSFWYHTVTDKDRDTCRLLNNTACLTRVNRQLSNACRATLSGGYFRDHYRYVRFTREDIVYNGADKVLAARYGGHMTAEGDTEIENYTALKPKENDGLLTARNKDIIMLPGTGTSGTFVLPAEYMAEFGLRTDPDMMVESIEFNGRLLLDGVDFKSAFGYIAFPYNPEAVFPGLGFMARSVTYRKRNILCYTMSLDNIYGPVDRVMYYYRVSQSPHSFVMAAAQACGLAVVREDCRIIRVLPLHDGAAYITSTGERYDAPYPHSRLGVGTDLPKNYVIGGRELLQFILPGDDISELTTLDTGEALPVRLTLKTGRVGLSVLEAADGRYGEWHRIVDLGTDPDNLVPVDGNRAYNGMWRYQSGVDGGPAEWSDSCILPSHAHIADSAIDWLVNTACRNKCIVVRINEGVMPRDMQLKLHAFIRREAPAGCVLTYSPLDYTIKEKEIQ